jgi:plasmid stabilization system protein ParE
MRLVFDSKAEVDLQNIARWIEKDSPSAAIGVIGHIKVVCSNLVIFPSMGKESPEPGTREVLVA